MARPETLNDIEIREVDMGKIDVKTFHTDSTLLKAWGAYLEALQKAGNVRVEDGYYGVQLWRQPTVAEQIRQLEEEQNVWDGNQVFYEKWAAGESLDAEWKVNTAKRHAQENGLPMFTWDREGKTDASVDETLDKIEELARA